MNELDLIIWNDTCYRVLNVNKRADLVLLINCSSASMPDTFTLSSVSSYEKTSYADYLKTVADVTVLFEDLSPVDRKVCINRFSMISPLLTCLDSKKHRSLLIEELSQKNDISKQTLRSYLCKYLIHQDLGCLAPAKRKEKQLTVDQKNMRWALNKFFYTQQKNSLMHSYTMMLKEKYTNEEGTLIDHPSFDQYRYFYRKNNSPDKFFISRGGIKDYQKNHRPLLGDGIQEYAPMIGTSMLDSTVADIYLVNDAGELVGRPIIVVACDANTSLCLGYSLLWSGGTYSLTQMILNILEDKKDLCLKMGMPRMWSRT